MQHVKHFVNTFKYMIMYGTHTIVHFEKKLDFQSFSLQNYILVMVGDKLKEPTIFFLFALIIWLTVSSF